jgi:hypothetical protein
VEWRKESGRAVNHVVLTDADRPGGQWAADPVEASWNIGALSYGEMLSLPGYSYAEHYEKLHGTKLPDFERPSRTRVAEYFAAYPAAVGISDSLRTGTHVSRIRGSANGFSIALKDGQILTCGHLVLGTGIFTHSIPPPVPLHKLTSLNDPSKPLLVIGSGFSAADAIISTPPHRKILHIYHWDPDNRPSPLRGCHHQAYPEYAGVYRQMKLAASSKSKKSAAATSPYMRRKSNPFFNQRDWASVYEGLPNAKVIEVMGLYDAISVRIRLESGETLWRDVGGLAYVVGRRGSLDYLDSELRFDVLGTPAVPHKSLVVIGNSHTSNGTSRVAEEWIDGRTLRTKAETSTEVAHGVFIIGSLIGDSLVRHAYGGCVFAASRILGVLRAETDKSPVRTPVSNGVQSAANGVVTMASSISANGNVTPPSPSQHQDLHVDRREVIALVNEIEGGG